MSDLSVAAMAGWHGVFRSPAACSMARAALVCAAVLSGMACAPPVAPDMLDGLLARHNFYRAQVGEPPLHWSGDLACGAKQWADHLAAAGGELEHTPDPVLKDDGENLWLGTARGFSAREMVDGWGDEKHDYKGGPITEDTVGDVGHYTQMIWRNTTQVGCAVSRGGGFDYLVCRYRPGGNVLGERPR